MQCTLKEACKIQGVGLLSGNISKIELLPAPEDTGIVFIKGKEEIRASPKVAFSSYSHVYISKRRVKVHLVEHLLAALWIAGIDNIYIKLSNSEIPILDGSALPFLELIEEAGLIKQNRLRKYLVGQKQVFEIKEKDSFLSLIPTSEERLTIRYELTNLNKVIIKQVTFKKGEKESLEYFKREIAPARTFSFISQIRVEAKGGNLDNALLLDKEYSVINKYNQRFEDEPIRHKILDLIGDLALLPINYSYIEAKNTHHKLHISLLKNIL